jgi:hypothetical protein
MSLRSRPRPRILASGVLEYWSIGVVRFPELHLATARLALTFPPSSHSPVNYGGRPGHVSYYT